MIGLALVALGIVAGYAHASLVESWCHDKIQHARKRTLKRLRRVPWLGKAVSRSQKSHTVVHHGMTFRTSYVSQFATAAQKDRADAYVQQHGIDPANRYGLGLTFTGALQFLLPFMPLNTVVAIIAPAVFSIPFALMSLISPALSRFVHPHLHAPYEQTIIEAPLVIRLLLRSPLGPSMWVRHFLHHRHAAYSFNLMIPVGDWLRGVERSPNDADLAAVEHSGGPPVTRLDL